MGNGMPSSEGIRRTQQGRFQGILNPLLSSSSMAWLLGGLWSLIKPSQKTAAIINLVLPHGSTSQKRPWPCPLLWPKESLKEAHGGFPLRLEN